MKPDYSSNVSADSATSYFGSDILGSVRNATDKYGTVQSDYSYGIFGSPYLGNLENDIGFGYCGKTYDVGTGLYNYGFRDYSPVSARFTTVDPVRDGANWFAYVVNDPVNYVDLWGLSPNDIFSTVDEAAFDFSNLYNDDSIATGREYGSSIYKNGNGYFYTIPKQGKPPTKNGLAFVNPSKPNNSFTIIAIVHTHGNLDFVDNTIFDHKMTNFPSYADQKKAVEDNVVVYTVGPSGVLTKFDPHKDSVQTAPLTTKPKGTILTTQENNTLPRDENDKYNPTNNNIVNRSNYGKNCSTN